MLQVIPIKGIPLVKLNDDIGSLIVKALREESLSLQEHDIVVIAQTILSKSEGRVVDLRTIRPSEQAKSMAKYLDKSPEHVQAILNESRRIERFEPPHLIVETIQGFVCANAGIDASNSGGGSYVTLLPVDPDRSAKGIQRRIAELTGITVGIVVTDTHGRPFREGAVNVAIGTAGIPPVIEYIGRADLYGYVLKTTRIAIIDEIAAVAELVTGESDEGIPVVVIRGLKIPLSESSISTIIRPREKDLFRNVPLTTPDQSPPSTRIQQ